MSQWDNVTVVHLAKIRETCAKCERKSTVILVINKVDDDGKGEMLVFCSCNEHADETIAELREDPRMVEMEGSLFINENNITLGDPALIALAKHGEPH